MITEPERPAWVRNSPHAHWYAVGGVCMGAFMIQLDASIVTLGLHAMQVSFDEPLGAVQWVSLSYVLTMIALVTPIGRISDVVGRKIVYLAGFSLFTVGSAACGLASDLPLLIAFRVVQAVGAAAIATNSVAVVTASMPASSLRAGLTVQSSVQALGLAAGPVIGGALVDSFGWRAIFFVNVPVGICAVIVGVVLLPPTRDRATGTHFDLPGTVLLATATTTFLLGLSGLSGIGLSAFAIGALFLASAVSMVLFSAREKQFPYPLVAPSLLRIRAVAIGYVGTFSSYLLLYAPLVLVPQLFIPLGTRESTVGPLLAALPLRFVVATGAINSVLPKGNPARLMTGAVVATCAVGVLASRPLDAAFTVAGLALLGIGLGIFVPANNAIVMANVPRTQTGMGAGLISMVRNLGTAVGVAAVTLALHDAGHDSRTAVTRDGPGYTTVLDAAHAGSILLAAAAIGVVTAMALRRTAGAT